jgi:hypothetical protein
MIEVGLGVVDEADDGARKTRDLRTSLGGYLVRRCRRVEQHDGAWHRCFSWVVWED